MKPVRCSKCKFFYDEDKYSSCPHCSDGRGGGARSSGGPRGSGSGGAQEKSGFPLSPEKGEARP